MSCGPSATRMMAATKGVDPGEAAVRAATPHYDPVNGTPLTDLQPTLQKEGFPDAALRPQRVEDLQRATENLDPAIVRMTNSQGGGHYVVVDDVVTGPDGGRTVYGRDPADGSHFAMPEKDFDAHRPADQWAVTTNKIDKNAPGT